MAPFPSLAHPLLPAPVSSQGLIGAMPWARLYADSGLQIFTPDLPFQLPCWQGLPPHVPGGETKAWSESAIVLKSFTGA